MAVYGFVAEECPAPQTASGVLDPVDLTTVEADTIVAGNSSTTLITALNANAVRLDMLARYGGGAYCVGTGLELSVSSGLTLAIGIGLAWADGPIVKDVAATLALTGNVWNRVWISRSGTLNKVTSASSTPLEPPDTAEPWVFLGSVQCGSSTIDTIDYSGRLDQRQGGQVWRKTYDLNVPTDTPPSGIRFYTRTRDGIYFWDGEEYTLAGGGTDALELVVDGLIIDLDDLSRKFRRLLLAYTEAVEEPVSGLEDDLALAAEEAD